MRIIVYVEGPSDKSAMQALLSSLIERKRQEGVSIKFCEPPKGDRKVSVLTKVPREAVNVILNDPHASVVAMPDLYPKDKGFPHTTPEQLQKGILERFEAALRAKAGDMDGRLKRRFHIFCFKYDLEALVLAAEQQLKSRLRVQNLKITWRKPVEDQDHDTPPKRVVEELFQLHNDRYVDTTDAPLILSDSDFDEIAERCPQCFRPFVEFLKNVRPSCDLPP